LINETFNFISYFYHYIETTSNTPSALKQVYFCWEPWRRHRKSD